MTADYEAIRAHEHAIRQVVPLLEAMRSVAEIAFRRAESRLEPLARYAERIDAQLAELRAASVRSRDEGLPSRIALVVVSSERGLCGAFNQRLVRQVRGELRRRRGAGEEVDLLCLGSQGWRLLSAAHEPVAYWSAMPSFALPAYLDVEKAALEILDLMESRRCGRLVVIHNAPLRRFQYQVTSRQLFPVEAPAAASSSAVQRTDVKPARDAANLYTQLITERVLIDLYRAVIESAISEELARVAAMRLATDNAQHLLQELTLDANRARQVSETNALLEIVSGFEAASAPETA